MATLGTTALTYADWAKRIGPDGNVDIIIELLSQANEIMDDCLVMEGNLPTGHKSTQRTGLPTATWRLMNVGVTSTKSTTAQIVDTCGELSTYAVVDKKIADLNGNTAAFRFSEVKAFLEGMTQQMAGVTMYGNTAVNPERFLGFAPRYNTVASTGAATYANVVDMGGTGSVNTSLWLITWGADKSHMIFPRGQKAGLTHVDKGDTVPAQDVLNSRFEAYTDYFQWDVGLTVRDWRYNVRACNIDTSTSAGGLLSTTPPNLINALVRMVNRMPTQPVGAGPVQSLDAPDEGRSDRSAFYCNRVVRTYLDLQALNKTNVLLNMEQWGGKPVLTFRGIPVRNVDQILNTEARIT